MIVVIMGPITTRGLGGFNRRGRRKKLEIGVDRMEITRPSRGRGKFYDNIG